MGTLTFASLAWTIVTNLCVFVACLVVFNVLRTWPISRMFYQPKRHLEIPWRVKPPRLTATSFAFGGWWPATMARSDEEILACAGQDALTYIRFLSFGFRLSLVVGLICMLTALPVNWIAGNAISCKDEDGNTVDNCSTSETGGLTNFDKTSLANIKNKSPFLWIHLVVVYIVSFVVMKMLWVMQKQAVTWRVKYLASTRKGAESHTILVQNIPGTLYGTPLQRIYQHMDGPLRFFIPRSLKAKAKSAIGGSFGRLGRIGQQVGTVAGKVPLGGAVKGSLVSNYATEPLDVYLDAELAVDHPANAQNAQPSTAYTGSAHHTSAHMRGAHVFDNSVFSDVTDEKDLHGALGHQHHNLQDGPQDHSDPEAESRRFRSLQDRESSDERVTDFDTWAQAAVALQRGLDVQELVKREFERTYPDVECVTVIKNQRGLSKLVANYDRTKQDLEDLIDKWEMQMQAGKQIKRVMVSIKPPKLGGSAVAKWGSQPCKVEKSEFLTWKLMDAYQRLSDAQQHAEDTCSAFVTFRKRLTQVQAASALHYHNETYWTTEPASGPQEVVWDNVAYRGWERKIRFVLSWALFIALTALFTIPVGFVQSMVNIKTLEKIGGFDTILNKPFLRGFITGVLPGLVMKIFLALVPTIIRFFNDVQGIYSHAQNDFEVGRKYFAFQYIQVFFIFVVGGSVYQNFSKASDDTAAFVKGFGQVIPSFANFYITYVLVSALIATPIGLMRIAGLLIYVILTLVYRGSERAKRRLWSRQYMRYGDDVPNHTLTIVILLTFCVMQPFITIPCVMYFATASFVARYQLLYVFREAYQSGGRFHPIIFDQIIAALFTFQIGMFAVLSVKQFPFSPLLVLPILMTALFRAAVAASFDRPLANLSAHAAADLDRADVKRPGLTPAEEEEMMRTMDCEDTPLGPVSELYLSPCFKVSPQKYKAVLDEVVTVRAKLAVFEAGRPVVQHPKMPASLP